MKMNKMAEVTTGATTYSSAIQAINQVIIDSKLRRLGNEETYKNIQKHTGEIK